MDESVQRALEKWPNVPACYGWLALDRRGRWRMRDENAQAHGMLGDVVRHAALKSFIDRNYLRAPDGAWYFQNGPQRVYVNLESTPFVLHVENTGHDAQAHIRTHNGITVDRLTTAYIDAEGQFFLAFDLPGLPGEYIGLVCDHDLPALIEHLRGPDGARPDEQQTLDLLIESPYSLNLDLPQSSAPLHLHTLDHDELPAQFDFLRTPKPEVA